MHVLDRGDACGVLRKGKLGTILTKNGDERARNRDQLFRNGQGDGAGDDVANVRCLLANRFLMSRILPLGDNIAVQNGNTFPLSPTNRARITES